MIARGSLFSKYVVYFVALVTLALVASGGIGVYFTYQENKAALLDLQREKAAAAASRIEAYVQEIEHQIGWMRLPQAGATNPDQRRFDYLKLLRQVPAITDVVAARPHRHRAAARIAPRHGRGRRAAKTSPTTRNSPVAKVGQDLLQPGLLPQGNRAVHDDRDGRHQRGSRHHGRRGQPQIHLGRDLAHQDRRQGPRLRGRFARPPDRAPRHQPGAAEIRSVVSCRRSRRRSSAQGGDVERVEHRARSAGPRGAVRVRQHPAARLARVRRAADRGGVRAALRVAQAHRRCCCSAASCCRCSASLFVARRMVQPIRAMQAGAARIGAGKLDQQIEVHTGDELEALADQFNNMAAQLKESYAGLERKVDERTRELTESLEQQTATSEILRVISSSPTDVQPVFDAIVQSALRLFDGDRDRRAARERRSHRAAGPRQQHRGAERRAESVPDAARSRARFVGGRYCDRRGRACRGRAGRC